MIHTKLPYNVEDFDDIAKNGAIVDISNPQFDGIQESEKNKTVLIYLRNTGFNVTLDFSNVAANDKFQLLTSYIEDDIECNDSQLKDTWIKLLCQYSNLHIRDDLQSILTETEQQLFIQQNCQLMDKLCNVYASLPIYLMLRLKDRKFDMTGIETDDITTVGVNFVNLLDDELLSHADRLNAHANTNYTKIFTLENNQLFDALRKSVLGFVLFAIQKLDK